MKTLALLPLFLLAACGGGAADEEKAPEPTALVRTAPAELGSSNDSITIYGATEATPGSAHVLVAPAEAVVVSVAAPTGTAVGRGQVIVTLRPSPATQAAIAKAAADAGQAQAAYQRALRLRKDGLVSDADVEAARAAMASANAARIASGMGGGGVALRAPVAGTVQNLTVKPGDQVAAGAALAAIGTVGDLRARFGVDPAIAPRLHPGLPIAMDTINGAAPANTAIVGVDPQVDPTTRLASVYVAVPAGMRVGAGEPLRATVQVGATQTGITIPYAALLDDGGRSFVFVVKNGVAKEREVSPGNSMGDRIQILKGLRPGERVVVEGGTALEDGMKVSEPSTGAKK
ncbi:MAG: efflux RND transporter periplasmic adaptor subunit [Proteobacteria bacterium]|nr:efflux RND transporter periplasmic adaptor subunit [Pseudomonadota bacterium]